MKFGIFMMPCHSPREDPTLAFERDLRLIEHAESLGFDEFWVGEHHTGGWETIPAPDIFLAAAATRTRRIRLGTATINLPFHHPFHVAERMAFLDHLTYGRLMMGCGPSSLAQDTKLFKLNGADLRPMMNESLDIILKLYRDDGPVSYEGEYWQIEDMEIQVGPYQQPHLPIFLISSGGANSIKVAAERGLPIISGVLTGPNALSLSQQWQAYEQKATEAGHSVRRDDWRLSTSIYLADSMEEAKSDIAEGAMREASEWFFNIGSKPSFEAYPGQPADEITIEQAIEKRKWIVGDPDYCAHRIKEIEAETGGFGGLLMVAVEWTSTQKWHRSLELFARYVVPQFKDTLRGLEGSYRRTVEANRLVRLPEAGSGGAPVDGGKSGRRQ